MKLTQAQLAHIKGLETARGQLSARRLLADAKRTRSPLHPLFNWNLKAAAEHWWLHRARVIIGAVTLQVSHHETVLKVPAYITGSGSAGQYRSVVNLRSDPDAARESLIVCLETAAGHLRRAYDIAAPLGLSRQIDGLLAQVAGVARIARTKKAA
jgi:hypothetical protein